MVRSAAPDPDPQPQGGEYYIGGDGYYRGDGGYYRGGGGGYYRGGGYIRGDGRYYIGYDSIISSAISAIWDDGVFSKFSKFVQTFQLQSIHVQDRLSSFS